MNSDYDQCEWCSCTKEQCKRCPAYNEDLDNLIAEVSKRQQIEPVTNK